MMVRSFVEPEQLTELVRSFGRGPLRLLGGDYPDREFMLQIVEHNIEKTLTFLG